jgi:4-methyl-5(b-hydroxyethyl)-thiazole monophosphate biosynthesis
MGKSVLTLIYSGVEEIEAVVTVDILRRHRFNVVVAALGREIGVTGGHDIKIIADAMFSRIKDFGIFQAIVIPGGPGIADIRANDGILSGVVDCLRFFHEKNLLIGCLCAAPLLLKEAGILPTKYTAHSSVKAELTDVREESVVTCRNVITSQSPFTAFEFASAIVDYLVAKES